MTYESDHGEPNANQIVESMVTSSIGPDKPMTPEALAVASVEVGGRLDAAREILDGKPIDGEVDTQAMMALFLIDQENGRFS